MWSLWMLRPNSRCVCVRACVCVCGYFLRRYYFEPINYPCTTDMTTIALKMYKVKLLQSAVCSCSESEDIAKWRFAAQLGWKWKCCKVQVWSSVESEGVAKCRFAAVLKLKMLQSAGLQLYWPFIYQLSTGILLSTSSIQTPLHKLHTHTTHTQICWIPSVSHFIHYR